MEPLHYTHWPKDVPHSYSIPQTPLVYNLEVAATRYPDKSAVTYYGSHLSYAQLKAEVDALAGYLHQVCGVQKGDRVLLFMQNSPQFVIGYYAILRANAVVVPANPMNLTRELEYYIKDAGISVAVCGAEQSQKLEPLVGSEGINHVIVAVYGEYVTEPTDLTLPDIVKDKTVKTDIQGFVRWDDAITQDCQPPLQQAMFDDMAAIIYTSGTTGEPKGCVHTHQTLMANTVLNQYWSGASSEDVYLGVVPFFHVTGMQIVMNAAIYVGAENVIMTRWDREVALELIKRYRITSWTNIPTMVIDLFASKNLKNDSLESLKQIGGGGASMPEAVAQRLFQLTGLYYAEGYGLTETASPTHSNPRSRPKLQCLGIPVPGTHSSIIDPNTLKMLGPKETGEIVVRGPQVFIGYWNKPQATAESFIRLGDQKYFRTGDLGYYDDDGYFFIVDRLKRMINASGYKVWPAEIESQMYQHPDIHEACIISTADAHRGETVKAVVVLKENGKGKDLSHLSKEIVGWCKERMSAYKYPRVIEFVDELPKSGSGKIQWRILQEKENSQKKS